MNLTAKKDKNRKVFGQLHFAIMCGNVRKEQPRNSRYLESKKILT